MSIDPNGAVDGAGDALVGSTIDVYWPLDQSWYTANVLEYTDGKHVIEYSDDDHVERLVLSDETWRQSTSRPARRPQWFDPDAYEYDDAEAPPSFREGAGGSSTREERMAARNATREIIVEGEMAHASARAVPRHKGLRTDSELPAELRSSDEAVAVWRAACAASEKQMHWQGYGWVIIWKRRGISTSGKQGDIYCYPPEHQPGKKSHQLRSLSAVLDWLSMRCDTSGENNNKMWMPPERMQLIEVLVDAEKAAAVEEGGDAAAAMETCANNAGGSSVRVCMHLATKGGNVDVSLCISPLFASTTSPSPLQADNNTDNTTLVLAAPKEGKAKVWKRAVVMRVHENGSFRAAVCTEAAYKAYEGVWAAEAKARAAREAAAAQQQEAEEEEVEPAAPSPFNLADAVAAEESEEEEEDAIIQLRPPPRRPKLPSSPPPAQDSVGPSPPLLPTPSLGLEVEAAPIEDVEATAASFISTALVVADPSPAQDRSGGALIVAPSPPSQQDNTVLALWYALPSFEEALSEELNDWYWKDSEGTAWQPDRLQMRASGCERPLPGYIQIGAVW